MSNEIDLENQTDASSLEEQQMPKIFNTVSTQSFRHDKDNIYINDVPIPKKEFVTAFGGALEVGARPQTSSFVDYANPVPAGLAAFSASCISLGFVLMQARHVTHSNVLIGAFLTTSGLVCLIVGILCFIIGNTWAACTFLMFGGFWSSFSFLLMDVGHVSAAYSSTSEYQQAIAFYILPWCMFSFALWMCTVKSTVSLTLLMFNIWVFLMLLTIAYFINSTNVFKATGFFLITAGIVGFYNMYAGIADPTNAYITIKPIPLPNYATKPASEEY